VPGSQRNVTSETTARPPSRFVSLSASIMTADPRRPLRQDRSTIAAQR
jgi:hypothetical protein